LLYTHPNAKEGLMVTEKETDYICGHTFSGWITLVMGLHVTQII
jgi:hypothetical protein